jgi:hypothetical protein
VSWKEVGPDKFEITITVYLHTGPINKKVIGFTLTVTARVQVCKEFNILGIVRGKICIVFKSGCFYLHYELHSAFGNWTGDIQLFCPKSMLFPMAQR